MPGGFVPRGPPVPAYHPPAPAPGGGAGNKRACRFGQGCTRQDCYFAHPEGRTIDGSAKPGGGGGRSAPQYRPMQPHYQPIQQAMSALQIKKETWYANARNCTCCKGFVYGCTTPACAAQEECTCSKPLAAGEGEAAEAPVWAEGAVVVDTLDACKEACAALAKEAAVAMDIEGVDLNRNGKVCVIQIAASKDGKVYLFDISTLGKGAMEEGGLKALLENAAVEKLLYDCRADSDALFHIYGVELENIADIQVLYTRWLSNDDKFLHGLQKALSESGIISEADLAAVEKVKATGKQLFAPEKGGSYDVWEKRPLHESLVNYCVADVKYLFEMKAKWGSVVADDELKKISQERMDKTTKAEAVLNGPQMAMRDI
eukprot:CAMPEP_0118937576 /NCGR_PEP_ID=MMETSP1169-20130426/23168_1 /TAXON_ID=36882 /ORGANISM="Pyramimonas obovata, Strain CCMP722" /LENGTH=372 /DNA_ID=CAMNT_0006881249 /DNA_START=322 /DNA_END=1440 /DNA_ORIENTATION=+